MDIKLHGGYRRQLGGELSGFQWLEAWSGRRVGPVGGTPSRGAVRFIARNQIAIMHMHKALKEPTWNFR
jgi:hypothetical protein